MKNTIHYKSENDLAQGEKAILTTLLYNDIFHFPLTRDELWQFLISDRKIGKTAFVQALKRVSKAKLQVSVRCKKGYYFLAGSSENVKRREANTAQVQKKMKIAKRAAYYLSYIPTIYFIGLSGGLAAKNVTESDDIDFFIITK